jgi:hypothetical protein
MRRTVENADSLREKSDMAVAMLNAISTNIKTQLKAPDNSAVAVKVHDIKDYSRRIRDVATLLTNEADLVDRYVGHAEKEDK